MSNVAGRVWSHAPAFLKKWRRAHSDARPTARTVEREGTAKHGGRRGVVHGPPYAALHKPRYEMGSALGRYGRRGSRNAPTWPQRRLAPAQGRKHFQLRGFERRAEARLRLRRQAIAKRVRSGFALNKQGLKRVVAKSVLAVAALMRASARFGRVLSLAHLLQVAHLARSRPHHTPLGRRSRQTSLRAEPAEQGEQMAFMWEEGEVSEPKETPTVVREPEANESGTTAFTRGGYTSPDAQFAANELHFGQSNARAIHGAISSASRHAQGKRDHRGM